MLIKRLYDPSPGDGTAPRVRGVRVVHTGTHAEQNWSLRRVQEGTAEGWLSIEGDRLVVRADNGEFVYAIRRTPGYYARGGRRIPISDLAWSELLSTGTGRIAAREAKAWLAQQGLPPEYDVLLHYETVLDVDTHRRFQAAPGALAVIGVHKADRLSPRAQGVRHG